MVTSLNTQVRTPPLTFEQFCAMLLEEELRQKAREGGDIAFMANAKKGKGKDFSNSSTSKDKKKKKMKCFYCGKPGHIQNECRKRMADEKNGTLKPNKRESANNADVELELFVAVEVCAEAQSTTAFDESWIIDSGASRHMTNHKEWYKTLRPTEQSILVAVGNDAKCPAKGTGTISFVSSTGDTKDLSDVLYVPDIGRNLLSVSAITDRGLKVHFDQQSAVILDKKDNIVGRGSRQDNLYVLSAFSAQVHKGTSKLWHERFGHISFAVLKEMQKQGLVANLPALEEMPDVCNACMMGKQHQLPFPQESKNRAMAPLQLVHADLCGKMPTQALGGSFYFLLFVDDYSRKMWVYFLKSKDEAFGKFKTWHALVENESGNKLKMLRTDRGGEFVSKEFEAYCNSKGIKANHECSYAAAKWRYRTQESYGGRNGPKYDER